MIDPELVKRHKYLTMFQLSLNASMLVFSLIGMVAVVMGWSQLVVGSMLFGCVMASWLHVLTFTGYD